MVLAIASEIPSTAVRSDNPARDTALALASKPGNTVLLGSGATPLVNVGK